MDHTLAGIIGVAVLLVALVAGVHIALALGVVGLIGTAVITGFHGAATMGSVVAYFKGAERVLVVIPLFIFMGVLAGAGGISRNLYNVISMWVGRGMGALGVSTVFSAAAFGAVTGSSSATATLFAKVSAPEMRRHGYDKRLAYGISASSGCLAMFIPPSIMMVFYAMLAEVSPGALLIAGIIPGLLLATLLSIGIMVMGYIKPALVGGAAAASMGVTWRQRFASLRLLWPVVICAFIIIGGIFGGVFSPNEAAAFGAIVLMLVTIISVGHDRWKIIGRAMLSSVAMSSMIFFILAGAALFGGFLMLSGITPRILGYIIGLGLSNVAFLIVMCLIYLVLGCFLDAISMLSITLPMIIPVVNTMGFDPIYFALPVLMSMETGLITPPVGLTVYATKGVAEPDVSIEDIFRGCAPFFFVYLVAIAILIAFPIVSTILPSLMFQK